jgi:AdoMet-dependent heme synthase
MALDFNDRPRLVFWEMTKACPLACVHCRAVAQQQALPGELTTAEGMALIDDIASCSRPRPILVLTGGDCLSRSDVIELAAYGHHRGVPIAISPSVSQLLTPDILGKLHAQGVRHASVSLDGVNAATHDGIRQVPGHFDATLEAIAMLAAAGYQVQVNTTVMVRNAREMADVAALLRTTAARIWEVFFLIAVGRASAREDLSAQECEDVCHFLVEAAQYGMVVRTVEAPFFRRVHRWRDSDGTSNAPLGRGHGDLYRYLSERLSRRLGPPATRVLAPTVATRDGKGIVFVAHNGDIYPSGFLPLRLGNVRDGGLLSVYRDHPTLHAIRAAAFPGRCGKCDFSDLCGGSRARSYAATGDVLGDDPACVLTLSRAVA